MNTKNYVDFLIIGAGKSGTTSLFRYLSSHPGIYMPSEKELSFFSQDSMYTKGFKWYLREYFHGAGQRCVWGEASPAYMIHPAVPSRVRQSSPRTKLVAILRNPVDRAFSHYCHLVRDGHENRSFGECIDDQITRGEEAEPSWTGSSVDWPNQFVLASNYGQLLSRFRSHFPSKQMKICFFEELLQQPRRTMRDLYEWLKVDVGFDSPVLGKAYNAGGEPRWPAMVKVARTAVAMAAKQPWLNQTLRTLRVRRTLAQWWLRMNTELAPGQRRIDRPTDDERHVLARYFTDDVRHLESMVDRESPWNEFR